MLVFDILDPGSSTNVFTVKSRKFGVLGTILFRSFSNLSFWEVDIKYLTLPHPQLFIFSFSLSNMCFVCIKETSQGDGFLYTLYSFFYFFILSRRYNRYV